MLIALIIITFINMLMSGSDVTSRELLCQPQKRMRKMCCQDKFDHTAQSQLLETFSWHYLLYYFNVREHHIFYIFCKWHVSELFTDFYSRNNSSGTFPISL